MNENLLSMEGRVAVVTGAGQGVGRAVALHFATHGAHAVVVNDYYGDRAASVAEEVRAHGVEALPLAFDVTDHDQVAGAFARVQEEYGQLHVLVNNAGNAGPGGQAGFSDFWSEGPKDWDRWLGTNLYGVLNCVRHGVPLMREHGSGRVITVISDAGRQGEPGLEVYSAAKAGAAGFMRAVARSSGRYGITANAVSIGATRTPFVADLLDNAAAAKEQLKRYMIRRFGEPEDIANMILFLGSGASSWVTGQTIPVNGGYSVAL
ncbi:SDR family NAD(P)-dependent oxidoreductase [Amycolatopsis jejuensis]|uniref:SDR family NAD(P)-dependent oxidoreductase n=1 Tax=Amycolatopsis jejuensis TaxID=330084 RepID=UPI000A930BDF|nr:SDR family NAD(P)-dependent oxidoreductase [Amycolatopsis jejuensis]